MLYFKGMQWAKKQTGFTIVELLIVVVVIAILAAITIVAYNGIQNRANDSAVQSDLKQMATQVELYKADKGELPRSTDFQALPPSVTKSAYGVLWSNGAGSDYNMVYCSPSAGEDKYALVAASKSGQQFYYGTQGNGKITLSNPSAGSAGICSDAGAPIPNASETNRLILYYQNAWLSWVRG